MQIELSPVTRLEGHLSVNTTIVNNIITDARCRGEMFRGFEIFLTGRDPLDAQQITQRICGVCPYAHAIASSRAQENAYKLQKTENGRILHNLVQGANHLYDYLLHFYQLACLDYIDITAILSYNGSDKDLQAVKSWVKYETKNRQYFPAAPFLPRLAGRYVTSADFNITAIRHYVQALEIEKKANQACAVLAGRFPHSTGIFPGGISQKITVDKIVKYQELIGEVKDFIEKVYIPDVAEIAKTFPEYWKIGKTRGGFLSFGLIDLDITNKSKFLLSGGFLHNSKLEDINPENITEDVKYSRYSSATGLKVKEGETTPLPGKNGAYTWTKAPRYKGVPAEVGPAARIIIEYARANNKALKNTVDYYLKALGLNISDFNSVLGRHLSRAITAKHIAEYLLAEIENLDLAKPSMPEINIPKDCEGFGTAEASRGALLHYIKVRDYKIDKYQCVVPTTWNISPMDDNDVRGPVEAALIGTYIADSREQIESGRIIRSFDPCLACSVH